MPDEQEVKAAFCRNMARGWVAGAKEIRIQGFPGFKFIPIKDGDWYLLDGYCTPPGNRSSGITSLTHRGVVVLTMEYGGWYEKGYTAFLKDVLREAYGRGEFHGGRGRFSRGLGGLLYSNRVGAVGLNFHGRERLYTESDRGGPPVTLHGEHNYSGMIFPS